MNQNSESLLSRFLQIQIEKPTKFDWVSTCFKDLKKLKLDISFEDIKNLPNNQFKNMIRKKCKELALEYLLNKRGSKGKEIIYNEIQTAEYLLPNEDLNIEEQRTIFSIRNWMIDIPSNFVSNENNMSKCICNQTENMKHIYECNHINREKPEVTIWTNFHGTIREQRKIAQRILYNMEQRSK